MVSSSKVLEAIDAYNRYHSPMATVELKTSSGDLLRLRFEGPFCRMCCDYDYFEDYIYELQKLGIDRERVEIADINYQGDERFVVDYSFPE